MWRSSPGVDAVTDRDHVDEELPKRGREPRLRGRVGRLASLSRQLHSRAGLRVFRS